MFFITNCFEIYRLISFVFLYFVMRVAAMARGGEREREAFPALCLDERRGLKCPWQGLKECSKKGLKKGLRKGLKE